MHERERERKEKKEVQVLQRNTCTFIVTKLNGFKHRLVINNSTNNSI